MKLPNADRVLAEIILKPLQGNRFQPTGFPSLGAAEFTSISNDDQEISSLLVESAQSMANRLEEVCWNKSKACLVDTVKDMPVINVNDVNGKFLTNSLLEAHRMNSPYILDGDDKMLREMLEKELAVENKGLLKIPKLARIMLKYDPNSIIHGLWLTFVAEGRYRMSRILSSFIEATNVKTVVSGGVKMDVVAPSGMDGGAEEGRGHVPYNRTEYSAESIRAYFNIDLALLRSYQLEDVANEFLFTLSLWKIRSFLEHGLRLRTACDLTTGDELTVTYPNDFSIPDLGALDKDLRDLINACKKVFCDKPLVLRYSKSKNNNNKG